MTDLSHYTRKETIVMKDPWGNHYLKIGTMQELKSHYTDSFIVAVGVNPFGKFYALEVYPYSEEAKATARARELRDAIRAISRRACTLSLMGESTEDESDDLAYAFTNF